MGLGLFCCCFVSGFIWGGWGCLPGWLLLGGRGVGGCVLMLGLVSAVGGLVVLLLTAWLAGGWKCAGGGMVPLWLFVGCLFFFFFFGGMGFSKLMDGIHIWHLAHR